MWFQIANAQFDAEALTVKIVDSEQKVSLPPTHTRLAPFSALSCLSS